MSEPQLGTRHKAFDQTVEPKQTEVFEAFGDEAEQT
jgi:hypothetical protein